MAGLTGNTKDTGDVNVRTDFVWGNFPPQPNDDRGSNTLDLTLGDHSNLNVGWGSYPSEPAGVNVGDRGTQKTVPSLADNATKAAVLTALKQVGFKESDVTFQYSANAAGTTKYWNAYDDTAGCDPAEGAQTSSTTGGVTVNLYNAAPTVALTSVVAGSGTRVVTVTPGAAVEGAKTDGTGAGEAWNTEFDSYQFEMGAGGTVLTKTTTGAFTYTFASAGTYAVRARGVVTQAATGAKKIGAWSAATNVTVPGA